MAVRVRSFWFTRPLWNCAVIPLLHGGGGPLTVTGFGDRFAEAASARVITPVHPGFGGTPRPDELTTVAASPPSMPACSTSSTSPR